MAFGRSRGMYGTALSTAWQRQRMEGNLRWINNAAELCRWSDETTGLFRGESVLDDYSFDLGIVGVRDPISQKLRDAFWRVRRAL